MENMTLTDNQVTKKSKLMTWIATILLGGAIALGTFLSTLTPKYKSVGAVTYEDNDYAITLNADELNNYTFTNLADYFLLHLSDDVFASGYYDTEINSYDFDELSNFALVLADYNASKRFILGLSTIQPNFAKGHFFLEDMNDDSRSPFAYNFTLIFDSVSYDDIKSAVELDIQANSPSTPQDWLTDIITLLTGGITGIASGIGTGVSSLVGDIFINNGALSVFGATIVIFGAVSLAIGLCRWVMNFLTSLGAKK